MWIGVDFRAVVLSLFGSVIGILLGLGLGLRVPFVLDTTIILVAFSFSALVG